MSLPVQDPVPRVPEGSAAYYALLFTPPARRDAIAALFALGQEFDQISTRRGEPSVTQAKMRWWDDEIRRLVNGQARHPVTRAMADQSSLASIEDLLLEMVACTASLALAMAASDDEKTIELECRRGAALIGAIAILLAGGSHVERILTPARSIGAAGRLTTLLRHEPELAASTRLLQPEARSALDEGLASLPREYRADLAPVLIYGQVQRRRVNLIDSPQKRGSRLTRALDTLRDLHTAWRTARNASRLEAPPQIRETNP
jgi:hypothetical protein